MLCNRHLDLDRQAFTECSCSLLCAGPVGGRRAHYCRHLIFSQHFGAQGQKQRTVDSAREGHSPVGTDNLVFRMPAGRVRISLGWEGAYPAFDAYFCGEQTFYWTTKGG